MQVAPEDCTGCGLCVAVCPAKSKSEAKHRAINMEPQPALREKYNEYWDYFLSIPELPREKVSHGQVKDAQLLEPLFEFSGACSGCGETPYISTMTRLFGDRALIANATGCSSIYGGNLPTTPYTVNSEGRGPAWSNSLFEDNAEFGMGMRLAIDKQNQYAKELVERLSSKIGDDLAVAILSADQSTEEGIFAQRERVKALKEQTGRGQVASCTRSAGGRRRTRPEERLDHRRRRLGLRHRLRRPRSRAGLRRQRQHPAARHRGLLQHRRSDVEGDAAWARWPSLPRAASILPRKTLP